VGGDVTTTDTHEEARATPEKGSTALPRSADELIPVWLAALVLVLLLAVVGVAGFVIRGLLQPRQPRTAAELAVEQAAAAAAARPSDPQARLDLAFAFQQVGRYRESLEAYDAVLKIDPKNTAALYNKGRVYFSLKDDTKGEELMWDVLEVSGTHVLASKALGDYYAAKGQYRSLLKAVEPAAAAHPEMADLQVLLGSAYQHLGRPKDAARAYRAALKYVPDMKEARDGLVRLGVKP
jgi:tetratricopeptide (TPR) repeat protein